MGKDGKENDGERKGGYGAALSTLAQISQIGFTFAFAVLISVGIGYWLDRVAGTGRIFKLIFLVVGVIAGLYSAYGSLSRFLEKGEKGDNDTY